MKIDMSMNKDEQKFTVGTWWATSPEFVLHALSSQLKAAAVIFPVLAEFTISAPASPEPTNPAPAEKQGARPSGATVGSCDYRTGNE
jgi:hypothetical protein